MDELGSDQYAILLPNGRLYAQPTERGDDPETYPSATAAATRADQLADEPQHRLGTTTQPLPQVVHRALDGSWRPVYHQPH